MPDSVRLTTAAQRQCIGSRSSGIAVSRTHGVQYRAINREGSFVLANSHRHQASSSTSIAGLSWPAARHLRVETPMSLKPSFASTRPEAGLSAW